MKTASTLHQRSGNPSETGLTRRRFVQVLGAGLLVSVSWPAVAQNRARFTGRGRRSVPVGARIHLGADGRITVLTGKVEAG